MSQLTHLIVLGRAIALLPPSALGPANPDLVRVPVTDAPPSSLVLAWAGASSSAAIETFARCAVAASALPALREFIGRWQARFPFKVVFANHAPA